MASFFKEVVPHAIFPGITGTASAVFLQKGLALREKFNLANGSAKIESIREEYRNEIRELHQQMYPNDANVTEQELDRLSNTIERMGIYTKYHENPGYEADVYDALIEKYGSPSEGPQSILEQIQDTLAETPSGGGWLFVGVVLAIFTLANLGGVTEAFEDYQSNKRDEKRRKKQN